MISEELRPLFEKIKTHLLTQNEKSTDEDGMCLYRGLGGLMCAAGCLIPDDQYDPEMENTSSTDIPFFLSTFNENENSLITAFQIIHDDVDTSQWASEIDELEKMGVIEFIDYLDINRWVE